MSDLRRINEKLFEIVDYVRDNAQCACSIAEKSSGHLVGCWIPGINERLNDFDNLLESLKSRPVGTPDPSYEMPEG